MSPWGGLGYFASSFLVFLTSAGASVVSAASRRVRRLDLCSSRWFRLARRRITLPVPVSRNRLADPLWVFILGIGRRLRLLRACGAASPAPVARLLYTAVPGFPRAGGVTSPAFIRDDQPCVAPRAIRWRLPRRLSLRLRPPLRSRALRSRARRRAGRRPRRSAPHAAATPRARAARAVRPWPRSCGGAAR